MRMHCMDQQSKSDRHETEQGRRPGTRMGQALSIMLPEAEELGLERLDVLVSQVWQRRGEESEEQPGHSHTCSFLMPHALPCSLRLLEKINAARVCYHIACASLL